MPALNNRSKYQRLATEDRRAPNEQDEDIRRIVRDGPVWKKVFLALCLLCLGTLLLALGYLMLTGHIKTKESGQAYGMLLLGCMTWLPGYYESRIAYYTIRGMKGYSFSSIPTV